MNGLTIKELNIGDKASFQKTITETDVYLYAGYNRRFKSSSYKSS